MFEGFTVEDVQVDRARLHVRHGGEGPPVLLLHGHPRTGATWHKVAPRLVEAGFTVVCPDLTGYGASANSGGECNTLSSVGCCRWAIRGRRWVFV